MKWVKISWTDCTLRLPLLEGGDHDVDEPVHQDALNTPSTMDSWGVYINKQTNDNFFIYLFAYES